MGAGSCSCLFPLKGIRVPKTGWKILSYPHAAAREDCRTGGRQHDNLPIRHGAEPSLQRPEIS